jgi:hypothetical protein
LQRCDSFVARFGRIPGGWLYTASYIAAWWIVLFIFRSPGNSVAWRTSPATLLPRSRTDDTLTQDRRAAPSN